MTPRNIITGLWLASVFAIFGTAVAKATPREQNNSNTAVMQAAHDGAKLAGAARFCNVDSDLVDEFISTTHARIAMLAKDTYEKIAGRLEFKNLLDASSVKAPEEGCDLISKNFVALVRSDQ